LLEEARHLLTAPQAPNYTAPQAPGGTAAQLSLGEELRTLALVSLGNAETWTGHIDQAEPHLEQAIALARRIGRPYLELMALVFRAQVELPRCAPRAAELSRQTIELAERHGWTDDTYVGLVYNALGTALAWQGRADEAETWVQRAERLIRAETEPMSAMAVQFARGVLELDRGRVADALAAFREAERLVGPHPLARPVQSWLVRLLVRLGDIEQAERVVAGLSEPDRDPGQTRVTAAVLWLARDDPHAATAALAPVLDGSVPVGWRYLLDEAFLLEAIAWDTLGDPAAAGRALERALDLAESDGVLVWFLLHPAPDLLERQARRRSAHHALIGQILDLLAGNRSAPAPAGPQPPSEPLSKTEIRVLRYLPTHLTAPEIASELSVSTTTVKTHLRNLYVKLGVHRRAEAVERARVLGLLAPSAHQR
jgi:LuxR family transcriptional regulator, maltose regulon positive regulatory protein